MNLLAIDTATEACSAALLAGGELYQRYRVAPREHATLILGMVDSVLGEAGLAPGDIDVLAFGRGPGSFTGVRIAAGVAQGIAYAAGAKVLPVSTLEAMAYAVMREHGARNVLAAIDARMQQVYWATFTGTAGGGMIRAGEEKVSDPADVVLPEGGDWVSIGTGCALLDARLRDRLVPSGLDPYPRAADIARLAGEPCRAEDMVEAFEALPVYLRDRVVS